MKKYIIAGFAAIVAISTALAGTESKKTVIPVEEASCKFRDTEFQLDAFGTGAFYRQGNPGWGGGLGLNAFAWRYFGLGVEQMVVGNNNHGSEWGTIGNAILRYPICSWNLAPYAMAGIGKLYGQGESIGLGHVGGGLEYRLTDHIGIFADSRWVYSPQLENSGGVLARTGLRFAF